MTALILKKLLLSPTLKWQCRFARAGGILEFLSLLFAGLTID
jgi:hypothetical protein